jgi:hypothetical protein
MALAGKIIVACAVLHNLCLRHGQDLEEEDEDNAEDENQVQDAPDQGRHNERGERRRHQLIAHFQRQQRNN